MKLDSRKYFGCCHAPGHHEGDISNSIRLTYFDALISNEHSGQFSRKSKIIHIKSICFHKDNARKINLEFLASIVIHSFSSHLDTCQCGHATTDEISEPLQSLVTKNSFEILEKDHFARQGKRSCNVLREIQKFTKRKRKKRGQSRLGKKENLGFFDFSATFLFLAAL